MDASLPSLLVLDSDELLKEVTDTISPSFRLQVLATNYVSPWATDHVLKVETKPDWIAIAGGGCIGLELDKVSSIEVVG